MAMSGGKWTKRTLSATRKDGETAHKSYLVQYKPYRSYRSYRSSPTSDLLERRPSYHCSVYPTGQCLLALTSSPVAINRYSINSKYIGISHAFGWLVG